MINTEKALFKTIVCSDWLVVRFKGDALSGGLSKGFQPVFTRVSEKSTIVCSDFNKNKKEKIMRGNIFTTYNLGKGCFYEF